MFVSPDLSLIVHSRSEKHVGPASDRVLLLLEITAILRLACPVNSLLISANALTPSRSIHLPGGIIVSLSLLLDKEASVGCLVSSAPSRASEGGTKAASIARLVEAISAGSGKSLLITIHTEVVDSVRVLEESRVGWVSLNVLPATVGPAAWHKMKILVHRNFHLAHFHGCSWVRSTFVDNPATIISKSLV